MIREKLAIIGEGLAVTVLSLFFLALSIAIPDNPVIVSGAAGWLSQARALPVLLSGAAVLLSAIHTYLLWQGKAQTPQKAGSLPWTVLLCVLTSVWLGASAAVGMIVPTVLYLILMMLLCGRKAGRSPLLLLSIAALYSVLALWVIPTLLRLHLR